MLTNLWSNVRCSKAAKERTVEITYTLWLLVAEKQPECKLGASVAAPCKGQFTVVSCFEFI